MTRRSFGSGILVIAVVVGAWAIWQYVGEDDYSHNLDRFGKGGVKNRFIHLDDGSQFSIGSPDRHRVVVQWKDRDGHGWTAPKTVWTEKKLRASDNTVRYGGTTVAIHQDFSSGGEYGDRILVGMICRDRSCEVEELPEIYAEPQITPDGRYAYLGTHDGKAFLWDSDDGLRAVKRTGEPEREDKYRGLSGPVLAEDGSLRWIDGSSIPTGCAFDLGVSKPGTAAFRVVGRAEVATPRPLKYGCVAGPTGGPGADWVQIGANAPHWDQFWIVRKGKTWSKSEVDPSGLVLNDYAVDGGYTTITENVNGINLAVGSPDRHRLQVQVRRHNTTTWTKVKILPGAPADLPCGDFDSSYIGRTGFVMMIKCGGPEHGRALAVSTDLERWQTRFLQGAQGSLSVDGDGTVHVGEKVVWAPTKGFVTP